MDQSPRHRYEFGPFRLSPAERRLYRGSEVVSLPPKVCDLLLVMVQNPGRILERENLMKQLWPDAVVEEANLNVHVSALRKALGEAPNANQFIETIPRRGYRFIAPVRIVRAEEETPASQKALGELSVPTPPDQPAVTPMPQPAPLSLKKYVWPLVGLGAGLVVVLVYLIGFRQLHKPPSPLIRTAIPLTSFPGREMSPAFSPDGAWVLFSSNRAGSNDLYRVPVAPGKP